MDKPHSPAKYFKKKNIVLKIQKRSLMVWRFFIRCLLNMNSLRESTKKEMQFLSE